MADDERVGWGGVDWQGSVDFEGKGLRHHRI